MKKLFAVISIIAVMGAGCAASSPLPADNGNLKPAPKMSMAQYMQDSWKIMKMQKVGGESQDLSELNLTLNFDGEKMSGKICNSMSGPYTVEDNLVKFGAVMQTKMFCEGLPGQVETAFTSGLTNNYTISKQGEGLVMQGAAVFVLERADGGGDY